MIRDILVTALLIIPISHVLAQSADPLDDFTINHILWDFVPPKKFYSTCMKVAEKVGDKSAKPEVCTAACNNVLAVYKDPDTDLHCKFMAQQMEMATLQEIYHGPEGFCKKMLMYQSYMMKTDVLKYVSEKELHEVCTDSISNAMDQKPEGMDVYDGIRQNLPLGCKKALEEVFRDKGMPIPIANIACSDMVKKANVALDARELSPDDQGKQFCDGNSMQAVAFEKSESSMAPPDFPMLKSNWKSKVTFDQFKKMVKQAYKPASKAFEKYDADGDGNMDNTEWNKLTADLGIPKMDSMLLRDMMDGNKNHKISKQEFQDAMGVNLAELVSESTKKHRNAEDGWKAADANEDGEMDPAEFQKYCKDMNVSPQNAEKLFPEIDKDGDGKVSEEEYKNVFGIDVPELKRRARDKYGDPKKSFAGIDADGDGTIKPEEFVKACEEMEIPEATAKVLLKQLDKNMDGSISPEEWEGSMGLTKKEAQQAIAEKIGANPTAMDTDGDGQVSPEELDAGLKKAGASPEEAKKLAESMDKDGDGKLSAEEIHEGTGGAAMDEARGFEHPDTQKAAITVPEFKARCKTAHGTPQVAFDAFDADKDGKISAEEFKVGAAALSPPISAEDAEVLMTTLDKNGDGSVQPDEFFDATGGKDKFGVTLPEFKQRAKDTFGTPQAVYDAMDSNPKDGKITPEEFEAGCSQLKPPISAEDCKGLFPLVDISPTDGGVTPEELFDAIGGPGKFGLSVPEFKKRAAAKSGAPKAAYTAMDANGDGKVSPEEFDAYSQSLTPPITPEESKPLFKQLDKNKSGFIEPEEFFKEVGKDSFSGTKGGKSEGEVAEAGQLGDTDGDGKVSTEEKLAKTKALDTDGDGQVSPKELGEAAAAGKLSPEEMKALDTDGDGKLNSDEIKQGAEATSASAADRKKSIDVDGDGKVSAEEMAQAAASGKLPPKEMAKMDADGDGKLSPEELEKGAADAETQAAAAAPKEKMKKAMKGKFKSPKEAISKMDTDGDGKISDSEMAKGLQDQGVSARDAKKMMKDLDKDGDGKVSPDEMYAATGPPDEFAKSPGEPGYEAPKEPEEAPVSLEEFKNRLGQAYKNGKDAWEKIAGVGAKEMTPEQFYKQAEALGVPPGEAKKLFKQIDLDGDGKISLPEWQEVIGVSSEEVQDRFVDAFGSSSDALKTSDTDGDGKVSEAELQDVMEKKLGLSPAAAKKAAKDMMKKLDPNGTGKVSGDAFKDATKPKADDVADKIAKTMGSSGDAMKKWDKDGDGKLTEEEFQAGAAEMGIGPEDAKDMWKAQDKDGDGVMGADDFSRAFGVGPDKVMEMCFQHYGNPSLAFEDMDTDQDGLLSPKEWALGATRMGLKADQIDRLFKDMDSNVREHTKGHLSKWEFYDYMDYSEPLFRTFGDGFGDLDNFGTDHKKFNTLPHKPATATKAGPPPQVLVKHSDVNVKTSTASNPPRALAARTESSHQKVKDQTAASSQKFMSKKEVLEHHNEALKMNHLKNFKKAKKGKKHHDKHHSKFQSHW